MRRRTNRPGRAPAAGLAAGDAADAVPRFSRRAGPPDIPRVARPQPRGALDELLLQQSWLAYAYQFWYEVPEMRTA